MFIGNLRAQPIDVIVAAIDANQFGAEHLRAENFRRLEIGRDKNQAFNPARAACAATEFARLPVDEQATVSNPKL
jgi:hypothetical protein